MTSDDVEGQQDVFAATLKGTRILVSEHESFNRNRPVFVGLEPKSFLIKIVEMQDHKIDEATAANKLASIEVRVQPQKPIRIDKDLQLLVLVEENDGKHSRFNHRRESSLSLDYSDRTQATDRSLISPPNGSVSHEPEHNGKIGGLVIRTSASNSLDSTSRHSASGGRTSVQVEKPKSSGGLHPGYEATSPRNSFILTPKTFQTHGFVIGRKGIRKTPAKNIQSPKLSTVEHRRTAAFAYDASNDASDVEADPALSLNFALLGMSGSGASSSVHKAFSQDRMRVFALKSIDVTTQEKRHQLVKELESFCGLKACPYIVKFYGAYYREGQAMIVLEYMNRGSLESVVKKIGPLPERILLHVAKQMLMGLSFIHKRKLIHRDIKPGNVLIDRRGLVKLTDFGISVDTSDADEVKAFVGTQAYMSPERISGQSCDVSVDIWAAGLVLVYCGTGRSPYSSKLGFFGLLQEITEGEPVNLPSSNYSNTVRDLVSQCLARDPSQRWTADELLEHPCLVDLDTDRLLEWRLGGIIDEDIACMQEILTTLSESVPEHSIKIHKDTNYRLKLESLAMSVGVTLGDVIDRNSSIVSPIVDADAGDFNEQDEELSSSEESQLCP